MNEQTYLQQVKALQAARWPKGTTREPIYPHGEKPVTEYLSAWARLNPTKVAIQFYGYELTYAQLDEMSTRFANVLRGLGVGQGDGVAVFMPNCPQFHIAFLGILKCGAVHMPVSPLSKRHT